jgi:hypothetical protein
MRGSMGTFHRKFVIRLKFLANTDICLKAIMEDGCEVEVLRPWFVLASKCSITAEALTIA